MDKPQKHKKQRSFTLRLHQSTVDQLGELAEEFECSRTLVVEHLIARQHQQLMEQRAWKQAMEEG